MIDSIILKTKIFDKFAKLLNSRQIKVLDKLFEIAPDNFAGGLSNSNYLAITSTSIATATRDLNDLVEKKHSTQNR